MFNCSDPSEYAAVQSNPDIAGPGVLIAFVGTGFTTILLLLLHYLFVHDPTLDPFRRDDQPDLRSNNANPLDVIFLRKVRWLLRLVGFSFDWLNDRERGGRLEAIFTQCILTMSDIQIVTGIAIMTTGFISVSQGLSAYHWQMLVYTAWFSTVTHLAALSQLRTYLSNHPAKRRWRLILMAALVVMLVIAMVPTIRMTAFLRYGDHRALERLAVCYFPGYGLPLLVEHGIQESALISILLSMFLVCFSFASRLVKLQRGASSRASRLRARCRGILRRFLVKKEGYEERGVLYTLLITRPCIAVWLVCRVYVDLFSSAMAEIFWVLVTALWGILQLTDIRSSGPASENEWSFGQIIAVLLLASPLMLIGESWAESLQDGAAETIAKNSGSTATPIHEAGTPSAALQLEAANADWPDGGSQAQEKNPSWTAREVDKWLDRDVYYHTSSWVGLSALVVAVHNFLVVWILFSNRRDVNRLTQALAEIWYWYLFEQFAIVALFFLVGMALDKYTAAWKLRRVLYCTILASVVGSSVWSIIQELVGSLVQDIGYFLSVEVAFIGLVLVAYLLFSLIKASTKALGRRRGQKCQQGQHPANETGTGAEHV